MFDWLKKLFFTKSEQTTLEVPEKLCKACGKPISAHISTYCPECKGKYKSEHPADLEILKCRGCGKTFTVPAALEHKPNYCPECKEKYRAEHPANRAKRTCRGCGKIFTVPAALEHKPNYCRICRAKYKKNKA